MRACHVFCLNGRSRCAMIPILRLSFNGPYNFLVNKIPRGVPCNGRDFGAPSPRLRLHDAEGGKSSSPWSSFATVQNPGGARAHSQLHWGTADLKQRLHKGANPFNLWFVHNGPVPHSRQAMFPKQARDIQKRLQTTQIARRVFSGGTFHVHGFVVSSLASTPPLRLEGPPCSSCLFSSITCTASASTASALRFLQGRASLLAITATAAWDGGAGASWDSEGTCTSTVAAE